MVADALAEQQLPAAFCAAPWMTLNVEPIGSITPCCYYSEPLVGADKEMLDLASTPLSAAWTSADMDRIRATKIEGTWLRGCDRCLELERHGGNSKRLGFVERFMRHNGPVQEGRRVLRMLSLALSNRCNLQCRSCYPGNSAALLPEFLALRARVRAWSTSGDLDRYGPLPAPVVQAYANPARDGILDALASTAGERGTVRSLPGFDVWDDVERHLAELEWIDFLGGEPLLIPQHESLLERIVAAGHAGHVVVRYNTNGTVIPPRVFELWRKFSRVMVSVSLDAIGAQFEYLRHPAQWARVEANVGRYLELAREMPHMEVQVNATLSAHTFLDLPPLHAWAEAHDLVLDLYPVSGADYLDPQVMPAALKAVVRERVRALRPRHPQVGRQLEALLGHMDAADRSAELLPTLRMVTRLQDEFRGQRFEDVFPELATFLGMDQLDAPRR